MNQSDRLKRQAIESIAREAEAYALKLTFATIPAQDTAKRNEIAARIEDWRRRIAPYRNHARQQFHMAALQARLNRNDRSARDRLNTRTRQLDGVRQAAARIVLAIQSILASINGDDEILDGIGTALDNIQAAQKAAGDAGDQIGGGGGQELRETIVQPAPGDFGSPGGGGLPPTAYVDVFTVLFGFFVLVKTALDRKA